MSRFRRVLHPEPGSELASLYAEILEAGWVGASEGAPANIITALAERPDVLKALWAFTQGTLMSGRLAPALKQMTALAIAARHGCRYCIVAHTNALEAMGLPPRVIESCAHDPELKELPLPQRHVVRFALKAASDPKSVTEADLQMLRDRGMGDAEIIEILMTVACANVTDFWAEVSAVTLDGLDESPE